MQSRYYDPEIGRFISMDSIEYLDPKTIHGLNLYAYCGNNPVMAIDPSGHFLLGLLGAVLPFVFGPGGGVVAQAAVSIESYELMAVWALGDLIFNNGQGAWADMNSIKWNPFNSDAAKAADSSFISFYRGVPVFMLGGLNASFSFGVIGLDKNLHKSDTEILKHERGHNTQLMTMGLSKFLLFVAIPSPIKNGDDTPWELSATLLGGSNLAANVVTPLDKANAIMYYFHALTNNPMLWLINIYSMFKA